MRALLLALLAAPLLAFAQAYPSKPVRLIVPNPPGGGLDLFARQHAGGVPEADRPHRRDLSPDRH